MAKYSPNSIDSLERDWACDPTYSNLPYSGAAVQSFIKSYLGAVVRATYFDSATATIFYFASDEDKQAYVEDPTKTELILFSTGITFNSNLYRVLLTNNNGTTTMNVATNQENVVLSIGFEVQTKAVTDTVWTGTNIGAIVSAYMDVGATGDFQQIQEPTLYTAGTTYEINVRQYLAAGANRVRVVFVDEDDSSITSSITYTVNMTEMFIEPLNNTWYLPIVEGGDAANYKFGGYRIIGALNKTLHMDVYSGDTKELEFQYHIGTASYDQVPFNYLPSMGLNLSSLSTGVYLVSAYLTSGVGVSALVSEPVNYTIMYIAQGDASSAQLVCINDVADSVFNYTTSYMFSYAIYNRGSMTGSPDLEILRVTGTTPAPIIDTTLYDVPTATKQSYSVDLEWLTEETLNLFVRANMEFGNRQTVDVPLDNSNTFPPTPGYDFYLNCATRSNADLNHLKLVNAKNNAEFTPSWTKMTWVDGVDGWIEDDIQRKCLYIRAGSQMSLPYSEYALLNSDGITLEFCYRVSNVTNYDESVIQIATDALSEGFRGIKIRPTNILVHSSADSTDANDIYRGTKLMDEEVVHFVLTIYPSFKGNTGKNLVTGYINGCKNFQFDYATGTSFNTEGAFAVGALKSDVSLYFVRKYNSVLSDANVQANYINSLKDINARKDLSEILASVMDANLTNISYESVKNSGKNFFVVEMLGGATVPSRANGWSTDDKGRCDLEMHYGQHPDWDWKIYNVEVGGQGTTSMNYYRWNLRWRIDKTNSDKKIQLSYLSSRTSRAGSYEYTWNDPVTGKSVVFDGNGNHPEVKRITAKINSASSMQSHKIGATWSYTELHDAIGLSNPAQTYAEQHDLPAPSVAVYQYPAYGFERIGSDYIFIGIFTIGPDKGDKPTFGYDIADEGQNIDIPSELITMEGTDHARKLVMFNSPWNSDVQYLASNESINIVLAPNSYDKGWEVGNCHDLSTDKSSDQAAIQTILEEQFKPAYDLVFYNSTLLYGIPLNEYSSTAAGTIEYINSHISTFTATLDPDNRTTLEFYHIWVEGDYDIYYYDLKSNSYLPTGRNLQNEHGTPSGETITDKNNWFRQKRRERFMATAENYWDIHDACYCYVFLMLFGSMDNFGKNSYPVKMGTFANGGRWGWRQDDLDSLGGIGNLGADTMPTWMEFQDSNNGAPYFGGSQSMFWNLIYECYMDDYVSTTTGSSADGIISTGKAVMRAMNSLAGTGGGILAGVMNYIKTRFWDKAQNYFPQSAYNADAAFKYEQGWLDPNYSGVSLIQSLGNHYSAEYYWFRQRMIYMMSFFKVGPFGDYADTSLGRINFRPLNWLNPEFAPSIPLYPALAVGTTMQPTGRTWDDESHIFSGSFGNGETEVSIMASNYLSNLGDWKALNLAPGYMQAVSVQGSKIIDFKIGDSVASNVDTNIPSIEFLNTYCMETLNAKNADSLSGTIDLSNCKRLKEAYLDGTSITQVRFANGQPIEHLSLPDGVANISMQNLRFLTSANLQMPSDLSGIELLQMEGCGMDAMQILYDIYDTNNSSLRYISVTVDGIKHIDNNDLAILGGLASGHDKDGNEVTYHGVTSDGAPAPTALPNIIGITQIDTPFYMETFEELGMNPASARDWGTEGWKINRIGNLGSLDLIYNPNTVYISFADSTVKQICATTWGDGTGLTFIQAAAVTDSQFGTTFSGYNSGAGAAITSFNELKYFTITSLLASAFRGCSNLVELELPSTCTSFPGGGGYAFDGCSLLERIKLNASFSSTGTLNFSGCSSLTRVDIPNTDTWLNCTFGATGNSYPFDASRDGHLYINNTEVTTVVFPSSMSSIKDKALKYCSNIESVTLPTAPDSVGVSAFEGCTSLVSMSPLLPSSIMTIGDYAFKNCTGLTGTLTLPSELRTIGIESFKGCTGFTGALSIPNKVTSIAKGAFSGCTGFTGNLVLSSSVTTISDGSSTDSEGSFYNCSGFTGTLEVPSTVTRIGNYAFSGCSGLTNVSYTGTNSGNLMRIGAFGCGNGTGTMYVPNCTFTGGTYPANRFKRMIIGAYQNDAAASRHFGGSMEEFRILGNFGLASQNEAHYILQGGSGNVKFVEILGIFDNVPNAKFGQSNATYHIGAIVHLGYDAVEHNALPANPTNANASYSNVETIYVGIGDATRDQQILDMYLADTDWLQYSSKLAKWSDYNGVYKTMPTPPFV